MKNNNFDRRPRVVWDINKGDLVKIKHYNYTGDVEHLDGIVLEKIEPLQQRLFPTVRVYLFKNSYTMVASPHDLVEIISHNS